MCQWVRPLLVLRISKVQQPSKGNENKSQSGQAYFVDELVKPPPPPPPPNHHSCNSEADEPGPCR